MGHMGAITIAALHLQNKIPGIPMTQKISTEASFLCSTFICTYRLRKYGKILIKRFKNYEKKTKITKIWKKMNATLMNDWYI